MVGGTIGSFQGLMWLPNSMAFILKTPTTWTPNVWKQLIGLYEAAWHSVPESLRSKVHGAATFNTLIRVDESKKKRPTRGCTTRR